MEYAGWAVAAWVLIAAAVMETRRQRQNEIWARQDAVWAADIRQVALAIASGVVHEETDYATLHNIAEYLDDRWYEDGGEPE